MKIEFLGTAANGGLPQVDCSCINCTRAENNEGYRRLRSSVLVDIDDKKIVLDCGPDFRQQMLINGLKLQDLNLIVVTHLHWDHVGGLMELSAGKPIEVPVLISSENKKLLMNKDEIKFLTGAGFARFINEVEGKEMGVELFDVPHDPNFPTSAVIVYGESKQVWYSPDVSTITDKMLERMGEVDNIIFDSTFLNEDFRPAKKLNHTIVEESAPILAKLNKEVIFSHINHSEDPFRVKNFLDKFGFRLAEDGMERKINN